MAGDEGRAEEIVIIRRRGGAEDDHHHGGVWKIAYADFMTAMMAFFLVMWLINASNTETKSSIASYFNPVKLTDTVSRRKGLYDIDERSNATGPTKAEGTGSETEKKQGAAKSPSAAATPVTPDGEQPASSSGADKTAAPSEVPRTDAEGAAGEAFRDPFNPLASARQLIRQYPDIPKTINPPSEATRDAHKDIGREAGKAQGTETAEQAVKTAQALRGEIEKVVKKLALTGVPGLDVVAEGDGVVLSLTDTSTFGMFSIGSAKPSDDLVKLVGAIAPAVLKNSGKLILRGHTDARPFPGTIGNNNWRLSMERAEAVYAMLIQSGVADVRFERIEAYADRRPKDPAKPDSAVNRRIDILLRPAAR